MAKIRDIQNSADYGRVMVDEQLQDLEARLSSMYQRAGRELTKKFDDYMALYQHNDRMMREQVESGDITKAEYIEWRRRRIYDTEVMRNKITDYTNILVETDIAAMALVSDKLPEVYSTSYNFGGYRAEMYAQAAGYDYTQWTIVNADAVRILAKKDPDLLPAPRVDIPKDERWNRQHIQNEIMQGLLQGESIPNISSRLMNVTNMDRNAALRNARTSVNGIENKGRKEALERVKEDGVPMEEYWSCTHDSRTRDSHIFLDRTAPDEEGYFANGLRFPGDPDGEPAEVYNCRCSLVTYISGIDHSKDDELYAQMMEEEYYDDWVKVKEQQEQKEAEFQQRREAVLFKAEGRTDEPEKKETDNWPDYKTASNRKEAVALLNELGFEHISSGVNKLDEQLFVENVNMLSKLNSKFGAIEQGMELKTGKMKATAYVSSYPHLGKQVELKLSTNDYTNKSYFLDREFRGREVNWCMPFSDEYAGVASIAHEYGHILQNSIFYTEEYRQTVASFTPDYGVNWRSQKQAYIKEHTDVAARNIRKEIINIAREKNPEFDLMANISTYGQKTNKEFFAEVFSNAVCGRPNELGNAMLDWLRRHGYDT